MKSLTEKNTGDRNDSTVSTFFVSLRFLVIPFLNFLNGKCMPYLKHLKPLLAIQGLESKSEIVHYAISYGDERNNHFV